MAGKLTDGARPAAGNRPRRELTLLLLAGAVGVGVVLLATRQDLARVSVIAPRPLPATVTTLTAQQLLPAAWALAVAALASLAAVLATRRWLRRVTGLITAALGAGIAAVALGQVTAAQVLSAASRTLSPATGAEAGAAPGSATAGGTGGGSGLLSGFPSHVVLAGPGWRYLMVTGALIVVAVGLAIIVRANRLPAMSARYERHPAGPDRAAGSAGADSAGGSAGTGSARSKASMWELLSAGADPTADDGR
ncbi:MAG: Trp biosynthesis-associated membrane protein [Streptosporangiaceae bacterium]